MIKKITSLILVFLLSCLTPITAFSAAAPLLVEENDVSSTQDDHDHQTLEERMALHPEIAIIAEKNNIDPEAIYFSSASQERLDAYYGAPDDILSSSTLELLEYFIENTLFMGGEIYQEFCLSSADLVERVRNRKVDYTRHEAFRELISRDDFIDALEIYAANITIETAGDEINRGKTALEKILEQSTVEALLSDPTYNAYTHPNIQRICNASEAVTTSVGEYVISLAGTDYYTAGTISTVNGRNVVVCTPNRELASSTIAELNNLFDYVGNTRIAAPTSVYNCHSYAWYQYSTDNPYWIMDISEFLLDDSCTEVIPKSTVQVKDIIVYYDSEGYKTHSGVVYSIGSSGEVTICSKWGQAGVYLHSIDNVPDGYLADPDNKTASYAFFRYHDYTNRYTGDEYHSGSQHYFRYADICDICNKETNESWISIDCMGPPCYVPWSIGTVVSRSKKTYKL